MQRLRIFAAVFSLSLTPALLPAQQMVTQGAVQPAAAPSGFFDGFFGGMRGWLAPGPSAGGAIIGGPAVGTASGGAVNIDPWLVNHPTSQPLVYPASVGPAAGVSMACPPDVCAPVCQPVCQPMACCDPLVFYLPSRVYGELLLLQATGVDMAHAQQQDGIGGAGTVPRGIIGVADPGYELGFRVGGGFALTPQSRLNAVYTWYDSGTSQTTPLPGFNNGAVGSLVHHPGAVITASTGPVSANYGIDFQVGEINYEHLLRRSCTGQLSYLIGLRYADLDQGFAQTGVFSGGQAGQIDTSSSIDFDGFGPTIGVEGERRLGNTLLFVYGRGSLAAISGEFGANYRMLNSSTAVELALASWSDDRIVPMFDYEIGIGWRGAKDHLSFSVGYLSSYWFNAITTPVFVDAVQANNYVNVSDTLAFDGLNARAEWRW